MKVSNKVFQKVSNWPLIITLSRVGITFFIVLLMILKPGGWSFACLLLFVFAGITDWLDGYLARKLKSVTKIGKLLDPMADKVLVSSVLILFIPLQKIEPLAVLILISRDFFVSGIRSLLASQGVILQAGVMGKWKTAVQMTAIPCVFVGLGWASLPFELAGYYGIWLSVFLSLVSGLQYFKKFMDISSSESKI